MIELRYKVVNKYLTEIMDIDVKESASNGKTGSVTVTNPLHCRVGEYLNTNLVFYDDSFNKSLNSGLLKSYLMSGAVKQVWYDTDLKKEVPYPNGQPTQQTQQDSATTELAKMFKEAGITKDDLKDIVALLKEKKQSKQEEPKTQTINQVEQPTQTIKPKKATKPRTRKPKTVKVVDNSIKSVDKNIDNTKKNIEKSIDSKVVDNFDKIVNNSLETEKAKINTFNYQQRLNYIKQCNDLDILKWIQSQFHQVAIFNAASNKISELETMKAGK